MTSELSITLVLLFVVGTAAAAAATDQDSLFSALPRASAAHRERVHAALARKRSLDAHDGAAPVRYGGVCAIPYALLAFHRSVALSLCHLP